MHTDKITSSAVPITSETASIIKNYTVGFITLDNHAESYAIARQYLEGDEWASKISYLTNIVDYLGIVRNDNLKLILVTDDERIGHKAAVLAASYHKYHHGGTVLMDILRDSEGEISLSAHYETSQEEAEEEEKGMYAPPERI